MVTARELSLEGIKEIRSEIPDDMEIETFIHGAMWLSPIPEDACSAALWREGMQNRGACTHPCRWKYAVMEESRPGEYMPVYENERGTYIFNSKDLCMIEHIGELMESGIDSYKIEGRMKTALYVATVARTYRMAIDDWQKIQNITNPEFRIIKQRSRNVPIVSILPDFSLENRMKRPRSTTVIPISKNIPIWEL